jgi:hypothetical protein
MLVHGQVMVQGKELAELEGLEAIDDDAGKGISPAQEVGVPQEAVSAEAGDVPRDGLVADAASAGKLSISRAANEIHEDLSIEVRHLLPVGGGEGLSTEGAAAALAEKPRDTLGVGEGGIVADALEIGTPRERLVTMAFRIWAVGRQPILGDLGEVSHAPA